MTFKQVALSQAERGVSCQAEAVHVSHSRKDFSSLVKSAWMWRQWLIWDYKVLACSKKHKCLSKCSRMSTRNNTHTHRVKGT